MLAEDTGWTLEYIDGLSIEAVNEWLAVKEGRAKYRDFKAKSEEGKARNRARVRRR